MITYYFSIGKISSFKDYVYAALSISGMRKFNPGCKVLLYFPNYSTITTDFSLTIVKSLYPNIIIIFYFLFK